MNENEVQNPRYLADEKERLRYLANRTDLALSRAMELAQYPLGCWSEDQDEDLKELFSECAEIYAMRIELGLRGRADRPRLV